MRTGLVIPSLGAASLDRCLESVRALQPAAEEVAVVLSGDADDRTVCSDLICLRFDRRLGFAAAANAGIEHLSSRCDAIAVLNDDAFPEPAWLGRLADFLERQPAAAAVQGTVTTNDGRAVDGRGIAISRWRLPLQVDRGLPAEPEPARPQPRVAVSATAALYRTRALREVSLPAIGVFDTRYDSYHEDVDVGLRLRRLGWEAHWVPGARCRHLGSASGKSHGWRHPWWMLANPWRVIGGNLTFRSVVAAVPLAACGELRAIARMTAQHPRAPLIAAAVAVALPLLLLGGLCRRTPGPRLRRFPTELE